MDIAVEVQSFCTVNQYSPVSPLHPLNMRLLGAVCLVTVDQRRQYNQGQYSNNALRYSNKIFCTALCLAPALYFLSLSKGSLMPDAVFNWLWKHSCASCLLSFINPATASHSSLASNCLKALGPVSVV